MIVILKIILYIAQGSALWASIFRWKNNRNTAQHYFLHFMIFIAIVEIMANMGRFSELWSNKLVYAYFVLCSFYFYFHWFYQTLIKKKLVLILLGLHTIIVLWGIFTGSFIDNMLGLVFYSGMISVIVLSVANFTELLQKKESTNFVKMQSFWITTGLLIYNLGFFPLLLLLNFDDFDQVVFQFANMVLNIILYSSITVALLCPIKN